MKETGYYLPDADVARHIYIKEDPELASVGHFHEGIELVAIVQGEVEACCLTHREKLCAGDLFFADSFEVHYYRRLSPNVLAIVLVLSSEYTSVFRNVFAGKSFPCFLKEKEKNTGIIEWMRRWLNEEQKTYMLNVGYCNIVLSKIAEVYSVETRADKKDKNVSVKLLKYINDHFTEDISMTSVAKDIGYTKEYCSKIFAEVVGMRFRDYLNMLRLKKANEYFSMKKELNLTTMEIVYKCGFNSTATFYRAQKALQGKNIKI